MEKENSSLLEIKTDFCNSITEDRLNVLILMYVRRNIKLDMEKIIDRYAAKYPKRMLLQNPFLKVFKMKIDHLNPNCIFFIFQSNLDYFIKILRNFYNERWFNVTLRKYVFSQSRGPNFQFFWTSCPQPWWVLLRH